MAELLRKEPNTQVELIDGAKGEFTVTADGREVARKNGGLPEPDVIQAAVRGQSHAATT